MGRYPSGERSCGIMGARSGRGEQGGEQTREILCGPFLHRSIRLDALCPQVNATWNASAMLRLLLAELEDGLDDDLNGRAESTYARRILSAHDATEPPSAGAPAADILHPMAPEPVAAISSQISVDVEVASDISAHDLFQKTAQNFFGISVRESVAAGLQAVAVGTKRVRASMVRIEHVSFGGGGNITGMIAAGGGVPPDMSQRLLSGTPIRRLVSDESAHADGLIPSSHSSNATTTSSSASIDSNFLPRIVTVEHTVLLPTADFTPAMITAHKQALSPQTPAAAEFVTLFLAEFARRIAHYPELLGVFLRQIAGAAVIGGTAEVRLELSTPNSRYHLGFSDVMGAVFGQYDTVAGGLRYQKLGTGITDHFFVSDNRNSLTHVFAPIYKRLGWNLHEKISNVTLVSLQTTCTEIDECLETQHACGDPAKFKNPCADEIDGYSCFCGNFTQRGQPSDPCDDLRMPHKTLHNNTCEWPEQWPQNDRGFKCTCDVGYYNAVDNTTGLEYFGTGTD